MITALSQHKKHTGFKVASHATLEGFCTSPLPGLAGPMRLGEGRHWGKCLASCNSSLTLMPWALPGKAAGRWDFPRDPVLHQVSVPHGLGPRVKRWEMFHFTDIFRCLFLVEVTFAPAVETAALGKQQWPVSTQLPLAQGKCINS